jgi:FkbM family methyltransferase
MILKVYSRLKSYLRIYLGNVSREEKEYLKLRLKVLKYSRYHPIKTRYLNYSFHVPDNLSFVNQIKDIFIDQLYKFSSSSDNPVIFDCGSNVGTSVIYFKSLFPKSTIKAYEADPKIFEYLNENLRSNNITNVDVLNKAVWTKNGNISFNHEGADAGRISDGKNSLNVESVRLKEEIEKQKTIDLIKMDIEGAEVAVLRDCEDVLSKVNNIVVEYHSSYQNEQHLGELLNLLKQKGFRYYISANSKSSPLVNNTNPFHFDLMANIYAYR